MEKIKYGDWELQINSNKLITVTKCGESREYDVSEIIEVQVNKEDGYVFLQHEECIFTQIKFEDGDFLVIDKFDREGDHIDSIGSHVFGENSYYQPEFKNGTPPINTNGQELYSFEVYRSKEECEKDFPNYKIISYSGNDIEEPTFVDYE